MVSHLKVIISKYFGIMLNKIALNLNQYQTSGNHVKIIVNQKIDNLCSYCILSIATSTFYNKRSTCEMQRGVLFSRSTCSMNVILH